MLRATLWMLLAAAVLSFAASAAKPKPKPIPKPVPVVPQPSVFVSSTGSDQASCTKTAPCLSFSRAYFTAKPGQIVEIAAGTYPQQEIAVDPAKTSPDDVVFQPAAGGGVVVNSIEVHGSHLTFQNFTVNGDWQTYHETDDVTFKNITVHGEILTQSSSNISVIGGSVGGSVDTKSQFGVWPEGTTNRNILVDHVVFHDVTRTSDDVHVECLLVGGVDGLIIRRSRFVNCAVFDLSIGAMFGTPAQNVTIENNWFAGSNGFFSLFLNDQPASLTNVLVRNNSTTQEMYFSYGTPTLTNVQVIGNIAPYRTSVCDKRISYGYNVWQGGRCVSTDLNAPAGFKSPDTFDFSLLPSSKAIGHADPKSFPLHDIDGKLRPSGNRPDAGAAEVVVPTVPKKKKR